MGYLSMLRRTDYDVHLATDAALDLLGHRAGVTREKNESDYTLRARIKHKLGVA
jgi:hypothetical protein